ncbi:hypothetical protein ABV409_06710 [Flagellimonas sp. DF-77]|uniref:hypothetical protein n=1 Tax=Flagellimonas algarum TaxID=3230298 RepID=UPI0033925071
MKNLLIIGITLLQAIGFSQSESTGIEIYLVNKSHPDLYNEQIGELDCYYCFEPAKSDLFDKPLIEKNDIEKFDWNEQKIILSKRGTEKLNELHIPLRGLAVALVLNNEPIYGFWFWTLESSFGCDYVYTYPKKNFKIKYGLPKNFARGNDPRFDKRIATYLSKNN